MSENKIIERIKEQFGSIVIDNHDFRGDQTVIVKKNLWQRILQVPA